jgi:Pyruvate/2-oxoacid:ferredoxin oxidoreductase delta subunit
LESGLPQKNKYRPFVPNPQQMKLAPSISGNTINGLNDEKVTRPKVIYWATEPNEIPHGEMQKWFYTVDPCLPDFAQERQKRSEIQNMSLPPVSENASTYSAEIWLEKLDIFVKDGVCEKIGVAEMDQAWVFEGYSANQSRIIITGVQHDFENIKLAPEPEAGAEVMRQYTRAANSAMTIAAWLHHEGWEARPLTGPMASTLTMIPAAIAAGFGELGKHGSIINPEFGSSFRLSAILTDAPLPISKPKSHGVDDFCSACRVCEDACPPFAILPEKKTVRGIKKWYVDFDKCLPFFNQHQGCGICIAVCPWSRPGVGLNLAEKLERKRNRVN